MKLFRDHDPAWTIQVWLKCHDRRLLTMIDGHCSSMSHALRQINDVIEFAMLYKGSAEYLRYYIEAPTGSKSFGTISLYRLREDDPSIEGLLAEIQPMGI